MREYGGLEWAILEELLGQRDDRDGLIVSDYAMLGDRFVCVEGTIDIPALAAAIRRFLATPTEGKLRVRALCGVMSDDRFDIIGWNDFDDDIEDEKERMKLERDPEVQFHWIEADIPEWQPPAEETVQGREVEG